MPNLSWILLFLAFHCQCNGANSYKILMVFPHPSPSHHFVGRGLMKGLIADGHEVTMISPFSESKIENFTGIHLDGLFDEYMRMTEQDNFTVLDMNNVNYRKLLQNVFRWGHMVANGTLNHPKTKQLLRSDVAFDVIVVDSLVCDALLGFGHHFKAPAIALSTQGSLKFTDDFVGTPHIPSYVPLTFLGFSDKMTFLERAENLFNSYLEVILIEFSFLPKQQQFLETLFPDKDMPSLATLRRNVSLVLLNTHVTLGFPRPYAPNMIEVGGLNIDRVGKPLPENLQTFLDGAVNGAILFSLGSNARFSLMSNDIKQAILNGFRAYPRMRLLMKLDENAVVTSHDTKDVLIRSWLPQESILAHTNIKLFVTHGGLLSTTESVYFGKPVVGIPIFADQKINMKLAALNGIGEYVPFEELSGEKFERALRKVLSDPRYVDKVKLLSDRYRDQIATPVETAVHWIKHVAKNRGAPHLRSASIDLPFYIYYNLDIYSCVALTVCLTCMAIKRICKKIFNSIKTGKEKVQ